MKARSSFVRRLQVGFAALIATSVVGLVFIAFSEQRVGTSMQRSKRASTLLEDLKEVQISFSAARAAEREFLSEDLRTPSFFQTGTSEALQQHARVVAVLIDRLASFEVRGGVDVERIAGIQQAVSDYDARFQDLVANQRERGSLFTGRIGEMREASFSLGELIAGLAEEGQATLHAELTELNRDQSEYLRNLDMRPGFLVGQRFEILREEIAALAPDNIATFNEQIDAYANAWHALLRLDELIGRSSGSGLRGEMRAAEARAEPLLVAAVEAARSSFESANRTAEQTADRARYGATGSAALAVILGVMLATWLGRHLRGSLAAVMAAVEAYGAGDRSARVGLLARNDEFATLGAAFDHLAGTLAEASEEIEEVNASLELAVKGDTTGLLEQVKRLTAQRSGR